MEALLDMAEMISHKSADMVEPLVIDGKTGKEEAFYI